MATLLPNQFRKFHEINNKQKIRNRKNSGKLWIMVTNIDAHFEYLTKLKIELTHIILQN